MGIQKEVSAESSMPIRLLRGKSFRVAARQSQA